MTAAVAPLHLFAGYGIELEYMIVDRKSLAVRPIADKILIKLAGEIVNEVTLGRIAWSNELVMHVLEIKSAGPQADLVGMRMAFQEAITAMNRELAVHDAMLMPTAMHPLFNPDNETHLWPYDNREIYEAYDRIFGCKGHGWSNLQSVHINLPFEGDEEFGRLHAAIRLILPLLPALAASSPLVEGRLTGLLDNRLQFYRENQKRIPAIAGSIVPERVFTIAGYHKEILGKTYTAITPHDPGGILQEEWLNSRGAIARFDRNAIEIRLLDIQESVSADFAIIAAVVSLAQALVDESLSSWESQKLLDEEPLAAMLSGCISKGENFVITEKPYLKALGLTSEPQQAGAIWQALGARLQKGNYPLKDFYEDFVKVNSRGTLSNKIIRKLGPHNPTRTQLEDIYRRLSDCLAEGSIYG